MVIRLSAQDSANYFRFKAGDAVKVKFTSIRGVVTDGDCYPELGSKMIFYLIKVPNSITYTYMEADIELECPA